MEKTKNNKISALLISFLIAFGLFALGVYTNPVLLILCSVIIPMVFVYIYATQNIGVFTISLILFGVLAALISNINYAVIIVLCTAVIAYITGYMIKKKTSFYYTVLASCVAMLLSLGVLILLIHVFYKESIIGLFINYIEKQLSANPELAKIYYYMLGAINGGKGVDMASIDLKEILAVPDSKAIAGVMYMVEPAVQLSLPQFAISGAALLGLLNYVIPRTVLKKTNVPVGVVPTFSMWRLPKHFGRWSLLLLVVAMIGIAAEWRNFNMVYALVMGLLFVTYTVQGIALVDWLLKKKLQSGALRVLVIVVIYIILSMFGLASAYMWVGFFEQIVGIRKRGQLKQ